MTSGTQVLLDHSLGTVHVVEVSLQMSQMAHQADAYLCFSSMKQLKEHFYFLVGIVVYPQHLTHWYRFKLYMPGWRVICLAHERNTMILAGSYFNIHLGDKRNYES